MPWKQDLMEEVDRTVNHLKERRLLILLTLMIAPAKKKNFLLKLRARDRERKLTNKINDTLELIEQGDYGFCDTCGVEIGIP